MTLILSIAQQKGGAGKTMLAANLAAFWAASHRVALLDIDKQRSLSRWYEIRAKNASLAPIGFSDVSGWRLRGELDRLRAGADVVIVDTPPQIDSDAAAAIRAASLVVVPVQPSLPDFWASEATLKLAATERRPALVVLNRAPAKSALRTQVEAAVAKAGAHLLPQALGDRRAFAQAFARGMGVTDSHPRAVAAVELAALAEALWERATK